MSEEAKDDVQQVKAERLQRSHGRLIRVVSVFPQQGSATPEDKLMLDLMYIESFSIWLDVKLLFRTLTVFFKADSTEGFDAPASTDTKHDKSLSA